jgi:hypothetical protein
VVSSFRHRAAAGNQENLMTLCNRVLDQRVSRLSFGLQYLDADTGGQIYKPIDSGSGKFAPVL